MTELDLRLEAAAASEYRDNSRDDDRKAEDPRGSCGPEPGGVMLDAGMGRRLGWSNPRPLVAAGPRRCPRLRHAPDPDFPEPCVCATAFSTPTCIRGICASVEDGTLILLDFGIMGRLDPITRRHYAEILFGFHEPRTTGAGPKCISKPATCPPTGMWTTFAQALRAIAEPIHGPDVSSISIARLLGYLLETSERFGMETRTELILLQRTMVVVEGVARSIDPHSNIWEAAKPVVEGWVRENLGPAQVARDIASTARVLTRLGPRLPDLAQRACDVGRGSTHPPQPAARTRGGPTAPRRWVWFG